MIEKICEQKQHTEELYEKAHKETSQVEQNYSQNAKVNLIEADDRIETHAEIQQQKGLVARAVENESILKRQIDELDDLQKSPYFGRIDIQDEDEDHPESLYIGISSFADRDGNFLIYDWRAPISSIYYNGTLGNVTYDTPAGSMQTELLKKRQFTINHGEIIHMFDTNETVGDELLQQALGEQNDEHMRNIVSTIQKEQNDIIRDVRSDLLVVQGVAGSGKTSAILQRIAFLLYHSRASLDADEIVLFSPNRLYSRYISDVLPSLGERNMRQLTLAEFFNRRLEGMHVQTLFDRFENQQSNSKVEQKIINFKEGQTFIDLIQKYEKELPTAKIKFANINYQGEVFFAKDEIQSIFEQFPQSMRIKERTLKTKNELIKRLKKRVDSEIKKDWVQNQINQISEEKYHELVGRRHFKSYDDENYFIGRKIVDKEFQIIDDAIFNDYFIDIYSQYAAFLTTLSTADINWQQVAKTFNANLEMHYIALEDAAPVMLLRDLLTGSGTNRKFQYVFIDEMQDYSIAQLMYLKHAFPRAKFTLLGDSEQTLFKDVTEPQMLLKKLKESFQVKRANLITLNRSYRSTAQITNFAAALLPDGDKIQAFSREGALPTVIIADNQDQATRDLRRLCQSELEDYGTIAILTKNMEESEHVSDLLRDLNPSLLNDGDRSLPKGIVVLPIYLAKGLEFDSVIAYNVSEENFGDQFWRGTLYIIASRAMHHLNLISIGDVSKLITNINSDMFGIQRSFDFSK
ncbi:superfamily I DNA RNA helicase [Pediococcus stilesii]|uniref:Superfamily I DNA RNA helicase n=1 Tax=Pediococcus stilesii TaxID=331679 RepID=A0A0R2KVW4_9LACO|nr:superfamily I DNA RNA helicase [Pediococcus stilesii]